MAYASVAILAGGLATRFGGRNKGALVIDGRAIIDRQIAELSRLSDDVFIVGGDPDGAKHYQIRYVTDQVSGCGPMGGIHAALIEASAAVTLVVACDMPYVSAPLGEYLLSMIAKADLVVPRTERGYHPLYAAYARTCLGPIAQRLADRRLRLTDLLADVRVRVVTTAEISAFGDPARMLANVNTLDEYRSIEAHKP